jgi:hypothetical protein
MVVALSSSKSVLANAIEDTVANVAAAALGYPDLTMTIFDSACPKHSHVVCVCFPRAQRYAKRGIHGPG